jgi:hypothetical protein
MEKKNYMKITIYIACPILDNYIITQTKIISYDSTFRGNLSFRKGKYSVSLLRILVTIFILKLFSKKLNNAIIP